MYTRRQDSNIDEAVEDQLHDIGDSSNWICHSWSLEKYHHACVGFFKCAVKCIPLKKASAL